MNKYIDIGKLEETLKIKITSEDLFTTAFTHRSYLNEHPSYKFPSNERLEFLGDAVLQLLSSEYLYENYPNPEGDLTNFRSALVCTESLGEEAARLGFGDFLLLSKGEEANNGRENEYILANTFEAVLGAIYLQENLEVCRDYVEKELFYKSKEIIESKSYKDAKSRFQEKAQDILGVTPQYKVVDSWGPDHKKEFKVAVYLSREKYGEGEGPSKQKAEQKAALNALDKLTSVC
jgi:ribonuclease-3